MMLSSRWKPAVSVQLIATVSLLFVVVFLVSALSSQDAHHPDFQDAASQVQQPKPSYHNQLSATIANKLHRFERSPESSLETWPGDLSSKWSSGNSLSSPSNSSSSSSKFLQVQVTAIHVDRAEFPLTKLLFKLTLKLALESTAKTLEPNRVRLSVSIRSANTCSRQYASALAAEEYYQKRARLFIVSGCDDAIRGVSRLASSWRVPVMTAAGFGADLNDKTVYKTLIRVAFSLDAAVEFLFKIMKSFQWRRVNLLVDESDPNSLAFKWSIEKHLANNKNSISSASASKNDSTLLHLNTILFDLQSLMVATQTPIGGGGGGKQQHPNDSLRSANATTTTTTPTTTPDSPDRWPNDLLNATIRDSLRQASMFSRVSVLLIPQQYLRKFMLSVYDQGMANGLYTFINMPLLVAANDDQIEAAANNQNQYQFGNYSAAASAAASASIPAKKQAAAYMPPPPPSLASPGTTGENIFVWRSFQSSRNAQAKQAFESLMSVYLRAPTTKAYIYFTNKLLGQANSDFNSRKSASSLASSSKSFGGGSEQDSAATFSSRVQLSINPYSASFYDCLQIYAIALNDLLSSINNETLVRDSAAAAAAAGAAGANHELESTSTGQRRELVKRRLESDMHAKICDLIKGRRYENMVTGTVSINANGDRETDYTFDDMNQMTGKFAPVILYRGESRNIERLGRIHWSSDPSVGPTTDTVDCYLTGTCAGKPRSKFLIIILLVAGPLALLLGGLFYVVHSKLSFESKLVDYWWKIHLNDIEFVMTRRKNANDGSLVLSNDGGGGGGSIVSSSHLQSSSRVLGGGGGGGGGGGDRSLPGDKTKQQQQQQQLGGQTTSILQSGTGCDRTTVTKATETSAMASSLDVCYGNISLGIYKLTKVAIKPISGFHQSRKLMVELRSIKDIKHNNLCRFIGIIVDEGSMAIVSEFCPKGSLREFFHNESMVIDWTFKYSIINDIISGLLYLHSSQLGYHGRLKSSNCLVSARFVVKLSDYGPSSLYEQMDDQEQQQQQQQHHQQEETSCSYLKKRLWLAPEHMKLGGSKVGSMKGDVYSFGLLLYEIVTNKLPFFDADKNDYVLPLKTLYRELEHNGPSESVGPDMRQVNVEDHEVDIAPLVDLMQSCWSYEPSKRPSSLVVGTTVKKITRGITSKKLLENLTSRMEQYTNNLESLVDAKLATLLEEKLKTEELLYQFVPKSIASILKEGRTVEPEAFECVTVFYSDIVGFTSLSSESSPMEVVDFLSDLYLCFDETLEQHDIFKVDTIGDAYIVASGLPQRNEGKHVIEIASAAIELRERLKKFKIPHKPDRALEMRVGIHSGPCIAGIVGGFNMPKYCVFGDTLAIGKFMESNGLPMRIHITEESRRLLEGVQGFTIEPRVPKISKDGLPFQTYWLDKADESGAI